MFAIIKTGGKQYRIKSGDTLLIEKIPGEANTSVDITEVLMIGNEDGTFKIGTPVIEGAKVVCDIVEQTRAAKVIVFKKRRRTNYRRKNGHRQPLTKICIKEIIA